MDTVLVCIGLDFFAVECDESGEVWTAVADNNCLTYIFVGFQEFLDCCTYRDKAIMYGGYGVKEYFVRKAALLIPNMEVGIPDKVLPFIFRNESLTLYVAPCTVPKKEGKIIHGGKYHE